MNDIARRTMLVLVALLAAFAVAQEQVTDPVPGQVEGQWQGAIETPGAPLEVRVVLDQDGQEWRGTIDIPAQGASGLPLENISVEGDVVSFEIAGVPGDPTFQGTLAAGEITGIFIQSGQEIPFSLTRDEASAAGEAPPTDEAVGEGGGATEGPAGPGQQAEYEDPQERFTFPIPTGWSVTEEDGYLRISGPEEGLDVYVVVSEGEDLEAAVADAWTLVDEEFELEPVEALEPPSAPGVERTMIFNYDADDNEQIYQAVAQLHEGTIYTLLIDAQLSALERRNAQLQIVATGFQIAALEEVDLTGTEPRNVAEVVPQLEAFIEEALATFGIPGAAVAVVQQGEIVYTGGFGVREMGGDEPITADTHMMIGSTGKTMTSMLLATLVDDGIVDWDTPVVDVLPEFAVADPQITEQFTVRHLLCACTGVPRRDFELFFNAEELTAEEIVESLATFEVFTGFGEAFQYSNQLVATAGYAAAAAAGADFGELFAGYAEALQERVLGPIGLENTTLSFDEVRSRGEYALPHQQNIATGGFEPIDLTFERIVLPVAPAGGHWSTAEDMARYMVTELDVGVASDGERVVSEENLRETWQPQVPVSATESYGLGWFVGEYKGLDWIYHGGNTLGFTSEFVFVPEADVGIVVLTNAQGSNGFNGAVATRLFELIFDQPAESAAQVEFLVEQTQSALEQAREQLQESVERAEVEEFLGRYRNEALGEVTLEFEEGQLYLDAGEFRVEIRPALDREGEFDTYVTYGVPMTGLPVELLSDEDEAEGESLVLGQGATSYTFERVE